MDIREISTLNEIWTQEYVLQGIPWKIQVKKEDNNGEASLGVYLHCAKNKTENWTHTAQAKFTLISFGGNGSDLEYSPVPYPFDQSSATIGTPSLIKWESLLTTEKSFVKNDAIQLKIEIEPADPDDENKSVLQFENMSQSCSDGCTSTKRLTISNIGNLIAVRSPNFQLRQMPWHFTISKSQFGNLAVTLQRNLNARNVSCEVGMEIKLISTDENATLTNQVNLKQISSGRALAVEKVVSFDDLMKTESEFVRDNNIIIEVEIKTKTDEDHTSTDSHSSSSLRCTICLDSLQDKRISATPCGHLFCTPCITQALNQHRRCPMCNHGYVDPNILTQVYLPDI